MADEQQAWRVLGMGFGLFFTVLFCAISILVYVLVGHAVKMKRIFAFLCILIPLIVFLFFYLAPVESSTPQLVLEDSTFYSRLAYGIVISLIGVLHLIAFVRFEVFAVKRAYVMPFSSSKADSTMDDVETELSRKSSAPANPKSGDEMLRTVPTKLRQSEPERPKEPRIAELYY